MWWFTEQHGFRETVPSVCSETCLTVCGDGSEVSDIRAEEVLCSQEEEDHLAVALPAVKAAHKIYYVCNIYSNSIERVEEFKYLGTMLTNKNSIQEEIKSRLKLGNACYYLVQNLFSSSLLCKKLKIKIYRTIILPVVLYGYETWSLTLRDERRLRVFENRVLRRVFGPKRDEVTGEWRKLYNEELSDLYS